MELPGPKTKTFFSTPGNANSSFNWPLEFPQYNFSIYPQGFNPPPPPTPIVWKFFWSSSNCHSSIIVIWLFGWNSPVHYWAIPEKLQTGRGEWGGGGAVGILFWNPPSGNFRFGTLPSEILEKTSFFTPGSSAKLCATILELEIPRSETKTQGNFTSVFL